MAKRQSTTRAAKRNGEPAPGATIDQTQAALEDINAKSQARILELVSADPIMREYDGMRKALLFVIEGPPKETENAVDETEAQE